jgi:hypothetical protein
MKLLLDASGRTAISRKSLSAPMKWLLENGHLEPIAGPVLLDYGCGRGSDVRHLNAIEKDHIFTAEGYDPNWEFDDVEEDEGSLHTNHESLWHNYDVVTCIYVLNVIKDKAKRREVEDEIIYRLKDGGSAFIAVRDDVKRTGVTSTGTWQGRVTPSKRWALLHHKKGGFRIYQYRGED